MSALSNFASQDVGGVPVQCRAALPQERDDALALILGPGGNPATADQVREFGRFAEARQIDLRNLWVIGVGSRLGWAALPVLSPGRTMLLLVPQALPDGLNPGPLLEAACGWFAARDGHLVQALLEPAETSLQTLFYDHGFAHIAQLLYLQAAVRGFYRPAFAGGLPDALYSESDHALFAAAILKSYQQSLDCPALNGLRDIEDIIAGHRGSGSFDPRHWFVLLERDVPVGALLLNRVPRTEMAELVYLGLAPQARGRGLGDWALRQAFASARQMGASRLTLAVDSRNAPALKLYYRHGLQHAGEKAALLRDLRTRPAATADAQALQNDR